jgi:mRNA interferase MazF
MQKDFDEWNNLKKKIDSSESNFYVQQRQIWWCSIGLNVGSEQNGHGDNFERPVLILRKYTADIFLCIPLTSKDKKGNYFCEIISNKKERSIAILSQAKVLDRKRLIRLVGNISRREFKKIIDGYTSLIKPV